MRADNVGAQDLALFVNSVWLCWAINVGQEFDLKLTERIVLERLAMHARAEFNGKPHAFCWPKIATLVARTGLGSSTIGHALTGLKRLGIIERSAYRCSNGLRHAKAFKLIREPPAKPAASSRIRRPGRQALAASGKSNSPPAAPPTCRQQQAHIEEFPEDTNLKNEAPSAPLAVQERQRARLPAPKDEEAVLSPGRKAIRQAFEAASAAR